MKMSADEVKLYFEEIPAVSDDDEDAPSVVFNSDVLPDGERGGLEEQSEGLSVFTISDSKVTHVSGPEPVVRHTTARPTGSYVRYAYGRLGASTYWNGANLLLNELAFLLANEHRLQEENAHLHERADRLSLELIEGRSFSVRWPFA